MTTDQQTSDLAVLRALGLKGRADAAAIAAATRRAPDEVAEVVAAAVAREDVKDAGGRFRLTPAGRERLADLLAAVRETVDAAALEELYERFHAPNTALKELMTEWQMRDGEPNDHTDRVYDDAVAARVVALADEVAGLVAEIAAASPHLAPYPARLADAARGVAAGDHGLVAKPLADSVHTVWFELHEELIALLGRDRVDEAQAGRAL